MKIKTEDIILTIVFGRTLVEKPAETTRFINSFINKLSFGNPFYQTADFQNEMLKFLVDNGYHKDLLSLEKKTQPYIDKAIEALTKYEAETRLSALA